MSERQLTQKQHTFCLKIIEHGNGTQAAIEAGYSPKTARFTASENLTKPNIKAFIGELRVEAKDASIMGAVERKQRLSEIGRGKVTDHLTKDGTGVDINLEKAGSVAEVTSHTEFNQGEDEGYAVITRAKMHNPMQAIDLLNKMEGDYAPEKYLNLNINVEASNLSDAELERIAASKPTGSRKRITQKAGSSK